MKQYIQGDDVFLYIKVDGTFMPICCLIDNPLDESTEEIETTARGSGGFRSYIPGVQDYRIQFSAFMIIDVGFLSYDGVKNLKRNREIFEWMLADADYNIADSGQGFFSSLNMTNQTGDVVTFSGTITPYVGGVSGISVWSQDGINGVQDGNNNLIEI